MYYLCVWILYQIKLNYYITLCPHFVINYFHTKRNICCKSDISLGWNVSKFCIFLVCFATYLGSVYQQMTLDYYCLILSPRIDCKFHFSKQTKSELNVFVRFYFRSSVRLARAWSIHALSFARKWAFPLRLKSEK